MDGSKRDALCELGHDDAVVFDNPDYDDAIIGVTDDSQVVYDYDKMVQCLINDGMTEDEAIEFIEQHHQSPPIRRRARADHHVQDRHGLKCRSHKLRHKSEKSDIENRMDSDIISAAEQQ